MTKEIEIQSWAGQSIASNACTLCDETPKIGTVSVFLKGYLGTHIIVHLCKDHWNDVGILLALSKAFFYEANSIENGPTWKKVMGKEPMPEIDRLILFLSDVVKRDPKLKKALTPELVDKIMEKEGGKKMADVFPIRFEGEGGVQIPHLPTQEEMENCGWARRVGVVCPRLANCAICSYNPREFFNETEMLMMRSGRNDRWGSSEGPGFTYGERRTSRMKRVPHR